ncbi:MAG: rod shape-determining protein RodA [Alphaproteobacteria bacterium]|nr:rod shape-determining protein RodA [Alphaproteobacteria bacterium]
MLGSQKTFRYPVIDSRRTSFPLFEKLFSTSWIFVLIIFVITFIGLSMLYSAGNGDVDKWALPQLKRFGIGVVAMFFISFLHIRRWLRVSYLLYFASLCLLIAVELHGTIGKGAQRWIDLGFIRLQPSEIMKISLVLALARYFHGSTAEQIKKIKHLIIPTLMVIAPTLLVLKQPDLGTALMLLMGAAAIYFVVGVRKRWFIIIMLMGIVSMPLAWKYKLHDYQKQRVLTFIEPERDPLGAGYHIIQSKITLGSGGLYGKGFMNGKQSHLSFLPEKQTDFIFTMLAEEFGMMGGLFLLLLYLLLICYGFIFVVRSKNYFGKVVAIGISTHMFLYVFINIAMVMGLIPVVGVPLPLVSYGGTAMLTAMIGFGFMQCVNIHHNEKIGKRGAYEDVF